MNRISVFKTLRDAKALKQVTFENLVEMISTDSKNPNIKQTLDLRKEEYKSLKYQEIKSGKELQCFAPCANFYGESKTKAKFKNFTGYFYYDIDNILNPIVLEEIKNILIKEYSDKICFISKSIGGRGLQFFVKVKNVDLITIDNFELIRKEIGNYFISDIKSKFPNIELDNNASGYNRIVYISYDENYKFPNNYLPKELFLELVEKVIKSNEIIKTKELFIDFENQKETITKTTTDKLKPLSDLAFSVRNVGFVINNPHKENMETFDKLVFDNREQLWNENHREYAIENDNRYINIKGSGIPFYKIFLPKLKKKLKDGRKRNMDAMLTNLVYNNKENYYNKVSQMVNIAMSFSELQHEIPLTLDQIKVILFRKIAQLEKGELRPIAFNKQRCYVFNPNIGLSLNDKRTIIGIGVGKEKVDKNIQKIKDCIKDNYSLVKLTAKKISELTQISIRTVEKHLKTIIEHCNSFKEFIKESKEKFESSMTKFRKKIKEKIKEYILPKKPKINFGEIYEFLTQNEEKTSFNIQKNNSFVSILRE